MRVMARPAAWLSTRQAVATAMWRPSPVSAAPTPGSAAPKALRWILTLISMWFTTEAVSANLRRWAAAPAISTRSPSLISPVTIPGSVAPTASRSLRLLRRRPLRLLRLPLQPQRGPPRRPPPQQQRRQRLRLPPRLQLRLPLTPRQQRRLQRRPRVQLPRPPRRPGQRQRQPSHQLGRRPQLRLPLQPRQHRQQPRLPRRPRRRRPQPPRRRQPQPSPRLLRRPPRRPDPDIYRWPRQS